MSHNILRGRWAWIGVLSLLFAGSALAQSAKDAKLAYKLEVGPNKVETVENLALQDKKRDKELPIKIHYPKGEGPFPVIVFSHGAAGSKDNYGEPAGYWASHGYVVIQPTHADSLSLRKNPTRLDLIEILRTLNTDAKGWENRARDITFILDSFAEIEKQAPELKGKLDAKRVGVGGHSYGAHTSQLIAGATIDAPGGAKGQNYADDRPKAFLLLSPQGKDHMGLTEQSWGKCARPMLLMTGSNDNGLRGQDAEWRKDPFKNSPAGDKYLVFIDGAYHGFGGISGAKAAAGGLLGNALGPNNPDHVNYVKTATLAFWDAYLKGEADAKTYLQSDNLKSFSNKTVQLERK